MFLKSIQRSSWFALVLCVCAVALAGCQTKTFAGFTFGGGGNTFSAEPARYQQVSQGFALTAGQSGAQGYLELTCSNREFRKPLPIDGGRVEVDGQQPADLVSGEVVLQAQQGDLLHGSFELKAKGGDGREFEVVGSFTAQVESDN